MVTVGVLPAHATAPGENGRIAFRRYFNDAHSLGAIFTIRPNGTGLVQLTHRGKTLLDTEPDWSPDGRWIVFNRVKVGVYNRIYKMRSDGTQVTRLDPWCANDNCEDLFPAWSPDGKLIAFTHYDYDTGIQSVSVMRPDGTHVRALPVGANGGVMVARRQTHGGGP
jgi:Tol biopolymer transport system component